MLIHIELNFLNLYKFWTATIFLQSVRESSSMLEKFSGETTMTESDSITPAFNIWLILNV